MVNFSTLNGYQHLKSVANISTLSPSFTIPNIPSSKSIEPVEILEIDQYTTLEASICVANRSDFENVIA